MNAPVLSTRQANKEKRRQRILDEARDIIASRGYDALNTRDLAAAAGVTTPTLYNLVGTKETILTTICLAGMDQVVTAMSHAEDDDAVRYLDGLLGESLRLIEADEAFFRGTLLAMFRLSANAKADSPETRFLRRGTEIITRGCRIALRQGLLEGKLAPEALGAQMFTTYAAPWRAWAYQRISLDEFRYLASQGFYMCLCSDASPAFLLTLRRKLAGLEQEERRAGVA
ncbi:MAG: TetR/AcrR family transcriptional regulator [Gammaproteobacteria bacterium]